MNIIGDGNHNNDDDINNIDNTNEEEQKRKRGKGRQKISMEKIQNETNLQVTFSKRRAGVFKKASELSTLCGAECAVVVFSPGNKPHSFGHPNVETVANRFLMNVSNRDENLQENVFDYLMIGNNEATMYQRNNHQLVAIDVEVEHEKHRKKELSETANVSIPPLDHLSYEELEEMKKSIDSFKHAFEARLKSKASETMWLANQNPQHQGLEFPAPVGYGYGATNIAPIFPGSTSSTSFGNLFHNFGTMQCPHMRPSGSSSNYGNIGVNPATIVPYNFGTMQCPPVEPSGSSSNYGNIGVNPAIVFPYDVTWRASGSGSGSGPRSGTRNRNGMWTNEDLDDAPQGAPNDDTGFGGNCDNSF